ncbi:hypothetical protein [Microcoleus sp. FACHB-831]|uniref:hypothetical protein n=1 Tax=Microcoleus sp. FACHB-831 TaxID=2692827 RepID=UPI001686BABB|nr:hypothetical protein [Microcoleus sp. FACHB-831]
MELCWLSTVDLITSSTKGDSQLLRFWLKALSNHLATFSVAGVQSWVDSIRTLLRVPFSVEDLTHRAVTQVNYHVYPKICIEE